MSDPISKPSETPPAAEPCEPQATADAPQRYEAPKLRRLGTLLELTQSGTGARPEAFRGSR
jgi:hypothetical protein